MNHKYSKIYLKLKEAILNGNYLKNQKLPSSRSLAQSLQVSRNTVLEAFAHLEVEGFIEGRPGSGMFVKNISADLIREPKSRKVLEVSNQNSEKVLINSKRRFSDLGADLSMFPFAEYSRITSRYYRQLSSGDFQYQETLGSIELRENICNYLKLKRQVNCNSNQILITNGSQEAIYLCSQIFLKKQNTVFIEEPTYQEATSAFKNQGATIKSIAVDQEGMIVSNIKPIRGALIYTTPSHQFPLGYTLSIQRRLALLNLAKKNSMIIIEDDFDSDFRYGGEPIASLQGYDEGNSVIYIGTFSKILFPALRLGYAVIPEKHMNKFLEYRNIINRQPNLINQVVTAHFMQQGSFYRHLSKMHRVYKKRKNFLLSKLACLHHLLEVQDATSGMYLIAFFKKNIDKAKLLERAKEHSLNLRFLSTYYLNTCKREGLILGFAALDETQIIKMINSLQIILVD